MEDDPAVASGVRDGLTTNGYTVDYVSNGTAALAAMASEPLPDIVLLDPGYPTSMGKMCAGPFVRTLTVPIIVIRRAATKSTRWWGSNLVPMTSRSHSALGS